MTAQLTYEYATRLLAEYPDGPVPAERLRLPDDAAYYRPAEVVMPGNERDDLLRAEIDAHLKSIERKPCELHKRLSAVDTARHRPDIRAEGFDADPHHLAETGRWLATHSHGRVPTAIGLSLLIGNAGRADVDLVRPLSLLDGMVAEYAIGVLASIGDTTGELIRVAERNGRSRSTAVRMLCARADPEAVAWLLRYAVRSAGDIGSEDAARVADLLDLPHALHKYRDDVRVVRHAARLLPALTAYPAAIDVYEAFAEVCGRLNGSVDDLALLARLANDLVFGMAALLPGGTGRREVVVERIRTVLNRANNDERSHDWRQPHVSEPRTLPDLVLHATGYDEELARARAIAADLTTQEPRQTMPALDGSNELATEPGHTGTERKYRA